MALTISGSPLIEPAAAAMERAASTSDMPPAGDLQKPDSVSAMVTARATGQRVEDLSKRTETSLVYANPDGTWTADVNNQPVRVQDDQNQWHDIDTTLVATDGGLAPKYAATDVVLSDGGDRTFASLTESGKHLDWRWPTVLPTPTVDGDTATYHDVAPGEDLVVTAEPDGFTHNVVLTQQPDGPVQVTTQIDGSSVDAVKDSNGGINIQTPAGKDLVSAPRPLMYDSSTDAHGDPQVTTVGASVGQTDSGTPTVTLRPSDGFLSDPDTQYPVTVDPSYVSYTTGDTWVQNVNYTTSQVTSEQLRAGTWDGGHTIARSYLKFPSGSAAYGLSSWSNVHVVTANLKLRNYDSYSCTGADIRASAITDGWYPNAVTWSDQPPTTTTNSAVFNPAYGANSSCDWNDAVWNVTKIFNGWITNDGNHGIGLRAVNESDSHTWRLYRSSEYAGGGTPVRPRMVITYNTFPATATAASVSSSAFYAPAGGTSTAYTSTTTPKFSAKASDSDGGTVSLRFEARTAASGTATLAASCTTSMVAQNSTVSCAPTSGLTDGSTYYLRGKAYDGTDWAGGSQTASSGWSGWTKFVVASSVPAKPVISCPGYADGSWTTDTPASDLTCTITAAGTGASAPVRVHYSVNGGAEKVVSIPQSSDPAQAKTTVTISKAAGGYAISATAEGPSGRISGSQSYKFGYGQLGLAAPVAPSVDPLPVTTGDLALDASGPPVSGSGTPTVKVQWRLASSGDDAVTGWNDADPSSITGLSVINDAAAGVHVTGRWDTMTATHDAYTNPDGGTGGTDLDVRKPVLLDVQVCVTYPSGDECTWSTNPRTIERVPHAFGNGFPTAYVDAGQVALWTGEFETDATDVTVPGFTDDLALSRTAASYAGAPTKAAGVFGPGWTAQLDGPDAGLAGMQLIDDTRTDGTLTLVEGDGTTMVFGSHSGNRRTGATISTGAWDALDEDTILSGTTATVAVTGSGASQHTTVTFTEADGTTTTFAAAVESTTTSDAVFAPAEVNEPGDQGITSYDYDAAGRVTRIWQAPRGVSCPAGAPERGCRVLRLDYTPDDIPAVPAGEARGQVRAVWVDIWNPDKTGGAGMDSVQVAAYGYDDTGRLTAVTDPRSNLTTSYTYDGTSSRLASIADPGLKPYQLQYNGVDHKLARVKRDRPAGDPTGGTATLDTILYNVPVSGTDTGGSTGLPSLTGNTVQKWGQTDAPTYAAAVFGPDKPVNTLDPAQVSASDWAYADLTYTDARGYQVNTANNGAGDWQYTATAYDDNGNVIRELDEGDVNAVTTGEVAASDAGTIIVYNADRKGGSGNTILAAGSVVVDTYGPVRQAVLGDGSLAWVRPHEHTDYDQGPPNGDPVNPETGQAYALPTTETTTADDPATDTSLQTLAVHKTGYDPIQPDDASGWDLGEATTETTVLGGDQSDIVYRTRYDALGRVIETRQPMSNGTDAGTRQTSYYQATGVATDTNCDGRPEWAGLPCVTDYAAAPSSGSALPSSRVAAYSMLLQPTRTVETSGSTIRTTSGTYLTDGRPETKKIAVTGLAASTPVPGAKLSYDVASGLPTQIQSLDGDGNPTGSPVTTKYDTWGRTTNYSAATGDSTTTSYNATGDVYQVIDNEGTTTWTYNGADANGNTEHRDLPTKLTVSNPNGPAVEFTGGYDAAGNLVSQTMPGGISRHTEFDAAGEAVGLTYTGDVNGEADQPWLSWSQDNDALGRVRLEGTPAGAAFDGDLTSGGAHGYSRVYSYDKADRLTNVIDNTAAAGTGGVAEPTVGADPGPASTTCQTRTYGFDANGNRKTLTVTGANADGSCAATGGSTKTSTYDTADRLTGGYTYDALGRATTIPAADTPAGTSAGNLTLTYYDDDSARAITQNGTTTTYTIDAAGRRSTSTLNGNGVIPETLERHYDNGSDDPAWIKDVVNDTVVTTRYLEDLNGDLAALNSSSTGSVQVTLNDMRQNVVTTVDVPDAKHATEMGAWNNVDEYGNGSSAAGQPAPAAEYKWLGGKQRAADGSGLVLMGARIYNPVTAQFSSQDPVFGGNTTAYAYPQDPINRTDTTGLSNNVPNGGKESKCSKLMRKIVKQKNKLARRARQFRENKKGFKKGDKNYMGHVKAFKNDQEGLRKLLRKWDACGCGGGKTPIPLPRGVWKLATRDIPVAAAVSLFAIWLAGKLASPACGPAAPACLVIL